MQKRRPPSDAACQTSSYDSHHVKIEPLPAQVEVRQHHGAHQQVPGAPDHPKLQMGLILKLSASRIRCLGS
jgi:hypothetical protein